MTSATNAPAAAAAAARARESHMQLAGEEHARYNSAAGCRAVKGGIPQIGVLSRIAGQPAMTKRVADRANNNQQLREGGQAAAYEKSSG
jgi:hypothetical protein